MTLALEIIIAAFLVAGGIFGLIGSYGLLKLRDPMQRLHAPTKATTIGVGTALVASAFHLVLQGQGISWHELLITLFLLLTAPVSALFLAKTHLFRTIPKSDLPDPGTGTPWATHDDAWPVQPERSTPPS
ncbi:Na+/H+ antiporter subunit G [Tabrizicola sp. BL-A-41-H6]|uniref:Na+/H+ antiporter subunit G n=1 Tax=Tabrizicola sp. BL-A-41-H6 TaxID=3421107 RepID=UPI003D66A7D4